MEGTEIRTVASISSLPPVAVSVTQAAELLGIGETLIRKVLHRQDFPAFKIGDRILISYDGLRDWAREQPNLQ